MAGDADQAHLAARLQPLDLVGEPNIRRLARVLKAFREARARHVRKLEGLSHAQVGRTAMHPRLNRTVNVLDMMVFAAEHDDHHLAGITEMLGRRSPPPEP